MPIPTYTIGYPPDGASLGQTKATIRNNLDGTFETLGVDHINNNGQPGSNPAGYHNIIHIVPQASDPAATLGFGQIYPKSVTPTGGSPDIQLFYQSSLGIKTQLTGPNAPSIGSNGYVWLPGPILMQWGSTTGVNNTSSTSVSFPITFPNAIFSLQATIVTSTSSTIRFSILNNATQSGFTTTQTSSANFTNLYWLAIGN